MHTLLQAIECSVSLSPEVRRAFASVDRAHFVAQHYTHRGAEWILEEPGQRVYEDRALITQVTHGLASSSSSQPSVMAAMLEGLAVQPGQRVLEIGTGTGYNAALLAHLIGEHGQVISIDINEGLIAQAQQNLARAHIDPTLVCIDHRNGLQGYQAYAPYDRIMVTASFRAFPPAWHDQLAPHGIVVGNAQGNLFTVMIKLRKTDEQSEPVLTGEILPYGAFFMPIHDEEYPTVIAPDWTALDLMHMERREPDQEILAALDDQAFLFFMEGQIKGMQLHSRAFGAPDNFELCQAFVLLPGSAIIHKNGPVENRGGVWEQIAQAYTSYKERGAPKLCDYQLFVTRQAHQTSLFARFQEEQWQVC